jgi:hypothetical protein
VPGRDTERWLERLARWGLVSVAVSFAVVAALSIKVALTGSGHPQGREGALAAIAREPFGKVLLVIVAAGFLGYAAWRLTTAAIGRTIEDDSYENPLKRIGDAARGLFYLGLAGACVKLLVSAGGSPAGGGQKERKTAALLLGLPGGRFIVGAIGLGVVGVGLYNGYRAISGKYRDRLKMWQIDEAEERIVTPIAVAGLFARMIVFGLTGAFLVASAVQYDAREAVGIDGALQRLVETAYGRPALFVVAVGLLCYALYRLTEARYRRI